MRKNIFSILVVILGAVLGVASLFQPRMPVIAGETAMVAFFCGWLAPRHPWLPGLVIGSFLPAAFFPAAYAGLRVTGIIHMHEVSWTIGYANAYASFFAVPAAIAGAYAGYGFKWLYAPWIADIIALPLALPPPRMCLALPPASPNTLPDLHSLYIKSKRRRGK